MPAMSHKELQMEGFTRLHWLTGSTPSLSGMVYKLTSQLRTAYVLDQTDCDLSHLQKAFLLQDWLTDSATDLRQF